ncbi:hypothetical protein Syun_001233 [Stephania yunnanensis]|uniref:Uncharacterized protein n=1 Tax=Stephania yunnanensis TaxID=152371 RepID=A0AAP0LDG4_9MAGN
MPNFVSSQSPQLASIICTNEIFVKALGFPRDMSSVCLLDLHKAFPATFPSSFLQSIQV